MFLRQMYLEEDLEEIVKLLAAVLMLLVLSGCYDKGSGDTSTNIYNTASNPIYQSGDLGSIVVLGTTVEAKFRFTMNPDEFLIAVHLQADYCPYPGNLS